MINRLDTIDSDQTAIRVDLSIVHKQNSDFAAQLDNLESKHTKAEIRVSKLETDIADVTAQVEALTVQVTSIEDKSMKILGLEKTLKDTVIGYEQGISDVDSRLDRYQLQWGKTESSVTVVSGKTAKLESRKYNEMIYDSVADLDKCGAGCTDCRKGHYALYDLFPIYQCVGSRA